MKKITLASSFCGWGCDLPLKSRWAARFSPWLACCCRVGESVDIESGQGGEKESKETRSPT